MESVEAYLNDYLRKWLSVSENIPNLSLYCDKTPCPFKKRRLEDCYNSKSQKISQLGTTSPNCIHGRKWKVAVEASNIDSKRKMPKVMGNTQIGRTGLGYIKRRKSFNDEKQQNHG